MDFFDVVKRQSDDARRAAVDLVVREERVVGDVGIFLLAHHHVGGVVQHALDEHAAGLRHQDRRVGMLAHRDRQTADVVEMAVRDDNQVEIDVFQQTEVWRGQPSGQLRIQTAVDEDVQVANLQIHGVGADTAVAVQINKLHLESVTQTSVMGGRKRKFTFG